MAANDGSDFIPLDVLQSLNESLEFNCLYKAHLEQQQQHDVRTTQWVYCILSRQMHDTTFDIVVSLYQFIKSIFQQRDDDTHCPTSFDTILCWPKTLRETLAYLPCLAEFKGVQYDVTSKFPIQNIIIIIRGRGIVITPCSSQKMHHDFVNRTEIGIIIRIMICANMFQLHRLYRNLSRSLNYQRSSIIPATRLV